MFGKSLSVEDLENTLDTLWLGMTLEYLIFLRQGNRLDDLFRSFPLLRFYVVVLNSVKKVKISFFSTLKVLGNKNYSEMLECFVLTFSVKTKCFQIPRSKYLILVC